MNKEKQMFEDLVEIFDEEYEKRRLITPQNTAEKMTAKGYVKQSEGEWQLIEQEDFIYKLCKCSACGDERFFEEDDKLCNYCPNCGAKMKGGAE